MQFSDFQLLKKTQLSNSDKELLMELWNSEYPLTISYKSLDDFEAHLKTLANPTHYILELKEEIVGWAFKFNRDNERWFALILDEKIQRKGIGSTILEIIKHKESNLCGWVIDHGNAIKNDGSTYNSPINFYAKHDFQIMHALRLETQHISAVKIYWNQS